MPSPGEKRDAVRVQHAAVEHARLALGADLVALARHGLGVRIEDREAQRTRVDAALGVGAQVVPARQARNRAQRTRDAVAYVHDVSPRHHDAAIRVQRDAAHAAALRHHRRHHALAIDAVHAAAEHVAEHDRTVGVLGRTFDEAVAAGQDLECQGSAAAGAVLAQLAEVPARIADLESSALVGGACP